MKNKFVCQDCGTELLIGHQLQVGRGRDKWVWFGCRKCWDERKKPPNHQRDNDIKPPPFKRAIRKRLPQKGV